MPGRPVRIPLFFYRTAAGNEPVREWLNGLSREDRYVVGVDIASVQLGWPMGMPLCRSLGGGLWEVRSSVPSGSEARVFIGFHDGTLIALHGFIKKTQRTPAADLTVARKRLKDVTR
jgi:phage-related protein